MSASSDMLFRRIAVEQRLITPADAEKARHAQQEEQSPPPLPVVMVELGLLAHRQVAEILAAHRDTLAQADPAIDRRLADWRVAAEVLAAGGAKTERVNRGLREAAARPGTLAQILGVSVAADRVGDTILDAGTGDRVTGTILDAGSAGRTLDRAATGATRPSHAGPTPRGRRFGHYEVVETLGRGGMGGVYKAWHPGLKSFCALKVLLAGEDASQEQAIRFRREAQALAKLRHPGIVAVHDMGEEDGKTWLAMDFVSGDTLARRLEERKRLEPEEAIRIAQELAEALAAAHAAGVLHRDLKPANVLIDAEGRVRLMDFGLAKIQGSDPTIATRTGELMGTPAYMSPEHVEEGMSGVDAQSDVYQVGAMLYEMLTGRRPYEGSTATEVMLRLSQEDAPPPRKWHAGLDRSAEAVCQKAMARTKSSRYASAAAFAEDCRRHRAGERVTARPEPTWSRWLRQARRRRAATALAAVATVALITAAAAGWQAWSSRQERERAVAAARSAEAERARLEGEVLAGLRGVARANLEAVLMVRRAGGKLHEAEQSFLGPLREAVAQATARAPALAEPHYHLGRFYRALLRFEAALAEQERALAKDGAYGPARYERGLLLWRAYQARLRDRERAFWREVGQELARAGGGEVQPGAALRPPARADLEDDAARDLKRRAAADFAASDRTCATGLRALAEDRLREARSLLEQAVEKEPDAEEAYETLAAAAQESEGSEAAAAWFTKGIEHDRGYVPHRIGRASARFFAAAQAENSGGDPAAGYGGCVEDLTQALDLDPERAEAWALRGSARGRWAGWLDAHGKPSDDLFRAADEDLGKATVLEPDRPASWIDRGCVRNIWASARALRGEDADGMFAAAVEDFGRGIELDRAGPSGWNYRGGVRTNWALVRAGRGVDPSDLYAAAVEDFGAALVRNPARAETWMQRGLARLNWGNHALGTGKDPAERFGAAISDFDQAIKLAPGMDEAWMRRGLAQVNWANAKAGRGEDPSGLYAAGIADLGEALARNPGRDESWVKRGIARANWGVLKIGRGEDPGELYTAALEDYAKALEVNATRDEAWLKRGILRTNWAAWKLTRGEDAGEILDAAIADFDEAARRNPNRDETWTRRAAAQVNRGYALQVNGKDPSEAYREAIGDYGRALERNSARDETWFGRGSARMNVGLWLLAKQEDPGAEFGGAEADLTEALKRNPARVDSWLTRGGARTAWAEWRARRGEDADAQFASAIADYEEGRKRNPRRPDARLALAQAHASRALALGRAGKAAEAEAEADRALGVDEGADRAWAARGLARLRAGKAQEAAADFAEYERRAPADDGLRSEVERWKEEGAGVK